jgi:hypothetical protein
MYGPDFPKYGRAGNLARFVLSFYRIRLNHKQLNHRGWPPARARKPTTFLVFALFINLCRASVISKADNKVKSNNKVKADNKVERWTIK